MAGLDLNATQMPPTDVMVDIASRRGEGDEDNVVVDLDAAPSGEGGQPSTSSTAPDPNTAYLESIRMLEDRLAEQQRTIENVTQRLTDTQQWAHSNRQEASIAQQLLQAAQVQRQQQAFEENQRRAMAAPQWSAEERDAIGGVLDPDLLYHKMMETGQWGARQALNEVAPYIRTYDQVAKQVPYMQALQNRMWENERERTLASALSAIEQKGTMSSEDAVSTLNDVYQQFYAAGGPEGAAFASINPSVVENAIEIVYRQRSGGVAPIKQKAKAPRSLGSTSSPAPSGGKVTVSREMAEAARKAEKEMGIKFTAQDYARMYLPEGR